MGQSGSSGTMNLTSPLLGSGQRGQGAATWPSGASGGAGLFGGQSEGQSERQGGQNNRNGSNPQDAFASLNDVNQLAPVNQTALVPQTGAPPPGNNAADWAAGRLFQNVPAPTPGGGTGGGSASNTIPSPAFGNDALQQLFAAMTGNAYPGPVPTALAPYGTQSSLFGNMTGLGNPLLLPMLLMMMNRPTTSVPFDPPVQPGSPDANQGVWPWNGGPPVFPAPGTTLPPSVTPPFRHPPAVPGGAANLPPNLPPKGQGPFTPGGVGPGGGGGGGGGAPPGPAWSTGPIEPDPDPWGTIFGRKDKMFEGSEGGGGMAGNR